MHSNEALAKMFTAPDNTLSPDEVGIHSMSFVAHS